MEYGLSGKCQTLLPEDKRGGKRKKKDMENSECLVECDWAGGRWRGTNKGAEGREGRRTEWRCNEEVDDKSPQQYLKTKLIISNLPEKHKILSLSYGLISSEATPPSSLPRVKGQPCCSPSACADEPWGIGRAGPTPQCPPHLEEAQLRPQALGTSRGAKYLG